MNDIQKQITAQLPDIKFSIAEEDKAKYGTDWTKFYKANPQLILFPKTTEEVQQIVQFANTRQLAIVPSGGRTGLSGGAVAEQLEIVVSLERMNQVLEFNATNQTLKVQAGVITEEVQNFAQSKGLYYPVDFASRGSSQIGGNLATNAGGIRVVRYGMTRDWVTGIKMVTGSGQIMETNHGLIKNATGYDLRHLVIGSEGTLGIITEVILKLTRPPQNVNVLFFAVSNAANIISILETFQQKLEISAFEFLSENALKYSVTQSDYPAPFAQAAPFYVLVELENQYDEITTVIENIVEQLYEKEWIDDDIIGVNAQEMERIWSYRERITEAVSMYTPYKNDISVLTSDIPQFMSEANALLEKNYPSFEVIWFGHIADGNLHISILKPADMNVTAFHKECDRVSVFLFQLIEKFKGSISAEHGLGLLKKDFIQYSRSEVEIDLMKSIKKIFDPANIMNPGKTI